MNEHIRQSLQDKLYQPANRVTGNVRKAVCDYPYASVAALAAFGLGLAMLLPASRRRLAVTAGLAQHSGHREMSAPHSSYFEPAPRSIYGSHRDYAEFTAAGPGARLKKGGPYLLGSAAVLTAAFYVLGRNNGRGDGR